MAVVSGTRYVHLQSAIIVYAEQWNGGRRITAQKIIMYHNFDEPFYVVKLCIYLAEYKYIAITIIFEFINTVIYMSYSV